MHTERTCKDEGKDWGDPEEARECQVSPANHQNPGERHGTDSSSQLSE